jgi:branched-chain amino acid transport system substrate-binding protein
MTRSPGAPGVIALLGALTLSVAACGSSGSAEAPVEGQTHASATSGSVDARLVIGALLPESGELASFGPAEAAGVKAALADINASGGVLGRKVRLVQADSGEGVPGAARTSAGRLLSEHADLVIDGGSSDTALSVRDEVTRAGTVQVSPSATSPQLDSSLADPHDTFFRTVSSDVLQARVLAHQVLADGHSHVAVLARKDSYGSRLADEIEKDLESGGGRLTAKVLYPPEADKFASEVDKIESTRPDAIVVVGYDETERIISAMIGQHTGPQHEQVYLTDGNTVDYSDKFPSGTLTGVVGTHPGKALTDSFRRKLLGVDPELKDFTLGPEAYDATVLAALAVEAAKSDDPARFAPEITRVSRDGETCTTFRQCSSLLRAGKDIDYNGVSGTVDLDDGGSPTHGTVTVVRYGPDNSYSDIAHITGPG